jgi:hypothetical protein
MQTRENENKIILLHPSAILLDRDTQSRPKLSIKRIKDYQEDLLVGANLPPIKVFFDGSRNEYYCADGFHRHAAYTNLNRDIPCEIILGTEEDAVLYSLSCNDEHGLQRSTADKYRSVVKAIHNQTWYRWSNREIARICAVSDNFVKNVKLKLSSIDSQMALAEQTGLELGYVNEAYENLLKLQESSTRITKRGGTIYEMNIKGMGDRHTQNSKNTPPPIALEDITDIREEIKGLGLKTHERRGLKKPQATENAKLTNTETSCWAVGRSFRLYCGDPQDPRAISEFPKTAFSLLFVFAKEACSLDWQPQSLSRVEVISPYIDDLYPEDFRDMVKVYTDCLSNAADPIFIWGIPQPSVFVILLSLDIQAWVYEPDPNRCKEAITFWDVHAEEHLFGKAQKLF